MGAFRITMEIGDLQEQRFEVVEALVNTGATYTVVPKPVLERLGVMPEERWPFTLADGRSVEYDVAQVRVRLDGRMRYTVVIFGDDGMQCVLLGAYTLEGLGLAPDPVNRRLIPVPGLLMAATGSCRLAAPPSSRHPSPGGSLPLRAVGRPAWRHPLALVELAPSAAC